jgi:predicted DCC family thiol-disulfide oxidoreductase YuxK
MKNDHPIVLFDGVCNYCNSWVNFAIKHDKKGRLRFTPLQSATGQQLKQQYGLRTDTDSVILIDNGEVSVYSDAALGIAGYLDWPAKIIYALKIFPGFLRQPVYKWIAKNRYKWFGKKEECMIPTKDIRDRFIL